MPRDSTDFRPNPTTGPLRPGRPLPGAVFGVVLPSRQADNLCIPSVLRRMPKEAAARCDGVDLTGIEDPSCHTTLTVC
jgi:hypothetical protein